MINMISNKLALYIAHHASKPQYLKADIEVLQYGIECMINTTCTDLLIFFFCVLSHTLSAGIVWIILFTFFRNLVGGYHAPGHFMCICLSTLLCLITILASNKIIFTWHQMMVFEIIILFIIKRIAPVSSSRNNPLSSHQQRRTNLKALLLSCFCIIISLTHNTYSSLIMLTQISVIILAIIEISIQKSSHSATQNIS